MTPSKSAPATVGGRTGESKAQAASRGVQVVEPLVVGNQEYTHGPLGKELDEIRKQSDSSNTGRKAGQYADKTYYLDADGNVTTSEPERGKILVAEGDAITPSIAAQLADK